MNPARMVFESAPAFIAVPADMQHRRVEAILWPLDAVPPITPTGTPVQVSPRVRLSPTATPLSQLIGKGKGCFDSAAHIDAFIRSERDAWER